MVNPSISQYAHRTWSAAHNHRDWADTMRIIFGDCVEQCASCLDAPELIPAGGTGAYTSTVDGARRELHLTTWRGR